MKADPGADYAVRGPTAEDGWRVTVLRRIALLVFVPAAGPMAAAQLPPMPEGTAKDAGKRPRLFVAQPFRDVGVVVEGEKRMVTWLLENKGGACHLRRGYSLGGTSFTR